MKNRLHQESLEKTGLGRTWLVCNGYKSHIGSRLLETDVRILRQVGFLCPIG